MTIPIDDYLQAIDPDAVCGDNLEYDPAFKALEQAIAGKPERQMGGVLIEAEPPNWREVKKAAEQLLTRTIDLRILISYLRSLVALEGFSGLADGLTLLQTLAAQRWDTLYPSLDLEDEDDSAAERINALLPLCDHQVMLWPLQQIPLLQSPQLGRFSFHDLAIASGKATAAQDEKATEQSTIDAAVQDASVGNLEQTLSEVTISLNALNFLENFVTEQVGSGNAPSFADLRRFLKECQQHLTSWLAQKGGGDTESTSQPFENTAQNHATVSVAPVKSVAAIGGISNNQDVIKTLTLICDYYQRHEPSSPIPLLLERAKRLVGKSFMDILKDIAPNGIDEANVIKGRQEDEDY